MTRKSKREIERGVDKLHDGRRDDRTDVHRGVTAAFVSYDPGVPDVDDLPDGCTVSTVEGRGGVTYHVVEREDRE